MKKRHVWTNAIPKTRKEKDILRLTKNPEEFNRMVKLLETATKTTESIRKMEDSKFSSVADLVGFIATHISDEFPDREVFMEEFNKMVDRYEEKRISREASDNNS